MNTRRCKWWRLCGLRYKRWAECLRPVLAKWKEVALPPLKTVAAVASASTLVRFSMRRLDVAGRTLRGERTSIDWGIAAAAHVARLLGEDE